MVRGRTVEWDLSQAPREPKLTIRLRAWERQAQEEIAVRAEREAARRPVDAGALSAIQLDLAALLASAAWSFRSKEPIAREFSEAVSLTPGQHRFARALYIEARGVVAAVDRRLAEPASQEALMRAEGREADLLEACRHLTRLDADRARDANSIGWDAPSSPAGHRLAGRDALTPIEAGHALTLVHRHRRQLPTELQDRLGLA